jgi:hypothetical protein
MSIKQIKDKFKKADKGWKIAFYVSQTVAIGLIIAGFFCPPMGTLDGSVLTAVGELFLFPTLYAAVHIILAGQDLKIQKGDFIISSNKDE